MLPTGAVMNATSLVPVVTVLRYRLFGSGVAAFDFWMMYVLRPRSCSAVEVSVPIVPLVPWSKA